MMKRRWNMSADEILRYLPVPMKNVFCKIEMDWDQAEEIRIRTGKPLICYLNGQEFFVTKRGDFVRDYGRSKKDDLYIVKEGEIQEILDKMSGYSMYAYEDELRQGYFTLEGGHRVGIAGKTVIEGAVVKTIKHFSFLNIRIAHEKRNCGKRAAGKLVEGGRLKHTLIISPPGCGKTTLLRDLIRLISDGFY